MRYGDSCSAAADCPFDCCLPTETNSKVSEKTQGTTQLTTAHIMKYHSLPGSRNATSKHAWDGGKFKKVFKAELLIGVSLSYIIVNYRFLNKFHMLLETQVRRRRRPTRSSGPRCRRGNIRGHTQAPCSITEDHPIHLREQTSGPGGSETQVQRT